MIKESNTVKKNQPNRSMRNPKTKQEKSKEADSKDQGVGVRGKRNAKNLPDDWDDAFVSNVGKKSNKSQKPARKTIRKGEEEEQSVYKQMKKGGGKVAFDSPEVKERKHMPPPSNTHKPKKGKGSFERNKRVDQDEQNCVRESTNLSKFIEAIMTSNHAQAHKQLKDAINSKIQERIAQEIEKPLF